MITEESLRHQKCSDVRKFAKELTAEEQEVEAEEKARFWAHVCKGRPDARVGPNASESAVEFVTKKDVFLSSKRSAVQDEAGNTWYKVQFIPGRKDLEHAFVRDEQLCIFGTRLYSNPCKRDIPIHVEPSSNSEVAQHWLRDKYYDVVDHVRDDRGVRWSKIMYLNDKTLTLVIGYVPTAEVCKVKMR